MNVVVIGASDKPERYSNKAVRLLRAKGHNVFPVHKRIKKIDDSEVFETIKDIKQSIHTVTLYVAKNISDMLKDDIVSLGPKHVILNPGAENQDLEQELKANNIEAVNGCTIVLLNTNQF